MKVKSISIAEYLNPENLPRNRIVVLSLDGCPPCEIVKQGLAKVYEQYKLDVSDFVYCLAQVSHEDKRGIGKLVLRGETDFPVVRLSAKNEEFFLMKGVTDHWNSGDVAMTIVSKIRQKKEISS